MKKDRMLSSVNLLLYLGVLVVNALANILPINGYNTGELSDMLPNLFVPAGLTFSIWGVIYILLALFVIRNIWDTNHKPLFSQSFQIVLAVNFLFNILWILSWHYRRIALSLLIMTGIFFTLVILDRETRVKEYTTRFQGISYRWAISVYFGWISVATIANITALLVHLGWDGSPFSEQFWTILVIAAGGLIAGLKMYLHRDLPFVLVFLWAYSGIIIKRMNTAPVEKGIITAVFITLAFILIVSLYSLMRHKRRKGAKA